MLFILLSSFIILPTLWGWGYLFENLFKLKLYESLVSKAMSGILGITIIWTIISFFHALNMYVELPTIATGFYIFFKKKIYLVFLEFFKKNLIFLVFGGSIILFCASFYPFILDHFGYYVPTLKWLTEYGLVKGVANLEILLAQTSFWHIFEAGFSNFSDVYLRINAVVLFIYLLYSVEKKQWLHFCFFPILLLFTQSPSPDLAVISFSLILLNEILLNNKNQVFIFTFSVFIFAIKPTMIWLPILCFLNLFLGVKFSIKNYLPAFFVLLVYFAKNLLVFGYPFFPMAIFDCNLPWKTSVEVLQKSSQYAIEKTYDNHFTYQQIKAFTPIEYVKNWLFIGGIKMYINIAFVVSLLGFIVFTIIKKNKTITLVCISVLVKSVFVLLFSAQYRFFIDVFFVIFLVVLFHHISKKIAVSFSLAFSIGIVLFLSVPGLVANHIQSFNLGKYMGNFSCKQFYKPSVYDYKDYRSYKVGNLSFNVSYNYPFNFETPTPSISESYVLDYYEANIFPQLIDEKDIRKGFISKKLNFKERKELEEVIRKLKISHQ